MENAGKLFRVAELMRYKYLCVKKLMFSEDQNYQTFGQVSIKWFHTMTELSLLEMLQAKPFVFWKFPGFPSSATEKQWTSLIQRLRVMLVARLVCSQAFVFHLRTSSFIFPPSLTFACFSTFLKRPLGLTLLGGFLSVDPRAVLTNPAFLVKDMLCNCMAPYSSQQPREAPEHVQ